MWVTVDMFYFSFRLLFMILNADKLYFDLVQYFLIYVYCRELRHKYNISKLLLNWTT